MGVSDLRVHLPVAVPKATAWAIEQERVILGRGLPLTTGQVVIATLMGVQKPMAVRVFHVAAIPEPADPLLSQLSRVIQLISPWTKGITFGYGIYIRQDSKDEAQLLAHELVHVAQYEQLRGISSFMEQYCLELATVGYDTAPMEREAIAKAAMIATEG